MATEKWDEADFTDTEGRLGAAYVRGSSAIWVPPEVQLGKWPDAKGNLLDCVLYPVPHKWKPYLPLPGEPFLEGVEFGNDLKEIGWTTREDTRGLVNEFVRLADAPDEKVLAFARKWGPMWLCVKHRDCLWDVVSVRLRWDGSKECCLWFPAEPIQFFRRYAGITKAVLDIAAHLIEGKPVSASLWREAGWCEKEAEFDIATQRFFLASSISGWLGQGIHLWVSWGKEKRPTLAVDTGLGFLRRVWLEIVQCVTGAKQLSTCDCCGRPYVRYGRKPQAGRKNYCPDCAEQGRKRVWARENRPRGNN